MAVEYQLVIGLHYSADRVQKLLNHMAQQGWTLSFVNANALYAVFQRETDKPDYRRIVWQPEWESL